MFLYIYEPYITYDHMRGMLATRFQKYSFIG